MDEYSRSFVKPKFEVSENSISVELPVIQKSLNLTEDEQIVYNTLSRAIGKSISEITAEVPFGKSKTSEILNKLIDAGIAKLLGNGRGTKYSL